MNRTAIANGQDEVVRLAATDADFLQNAVNITATVGSFHRHLSALSRSGVSGDDLINHPIALAFVSKLVDLTRMNVIREMNALEAIVKLKQGEQVEYEVIPID